MPSTDDPAFFTAAYERPVRAWTIAGHGGNAARTAVTTAWRFRRAAAAEVAACGGARQLAVRYSFARRLAAANESTPRLIRYAWPR